MQNVSFWMSRTHLCIVLSHLKPIKCPFQQAYFQPNPSAHCREAQSQSWSYSFWVKPPWSTLGLSFYAMCWRISLKVGLLKMSFYRLQKIVHGMQVRLYRHSKVFDVFGSGVSIIEDWSFSKVFPKFQLEIWTGTAWIFSESTATSISFPIQISKSIFSQTKANTMK